MANPYPYKRHGLIDSPFAQGGGVAFRQSAPPGSMQGMPTSSARSYAEFLALQKKKREEAALKGLLANPELGNISMSQSGFPSDPAPDPITNLLNESADTSKIDRMLNAALENLGVSSAQASDVPSQDHTTWQAEREAAEREAAERGNADRIPVGYGQDDPTGAAYGGRFESGSTDQAIRGLLADAARSGRSIERADDPEGAAQAVDDFSAYPTPPTSFLGEVYEGAGSPGLLERSDPTETSDTGPFQGYAQGMIDTQVDREATQAARESETGSPRPTLADTVLPDTDVEQAIIERKKSNAARQIQTDVGAQNLTISEIKDLAQSTINVSSDNGESISEQAADTVSNAWSPRQTFPRNIAQKRKRYLDAMNDIFTKAMILNVIAAMTGTESNAEFFVQMALAKMEAIEGFDGKERLENLSQVIFFDKDGNYSPPKSKQDAYNRARMAKASQKEAEHLSGHLGTGQLTSAEKNLRKTEELQTKHTDALKKYGENSQEAKIAMWTLDVWQTLSKQRTGTLTPQNMITARKDSFEKLFGKQIKGKWKLPGDSSITIPVSMWYHWINGTVPPKSETGSDLWTVDKEGVYNIKSGNTNYQIPTWDAMSQSALLKDVKDLSASISIDDGRPEEDVVDPIDAEEQWLLYGSIVIDSQEAFDALDSGTIFKDPYGVLKVKP
tara:strand:+ start:114 stop:2132 length:2019 start_codon:yes stop_codon:yes gene_type:complete